jgi:hemoglobin
MGQPSRAWSIVLLGSIVLAGCAGVRPEKTLYERVGGLPTIRQVVDDFVNRLRADPRVQEFFADSNIPMVKERITHLTCEVAGGPCTYLGADMKTSHVGLRISDAHFDAVVEDFAASLDKFGVRPREKGEFLSILGKLRADIVENR